MKAYVRTQQIERSIDLNILRDIFLMIALKSLFALPQKSMATIVKYSHPVRFLLPCNVVDIMIFFWGLFGSNMHDFTSNNILNNAEADSYRS